MKPIRWLLLGASRLTSQGEVLLFGGLWPPGGVRSSVNGDEVGWGEVGTVDDEMMMVRIG